MEIDGRDAESSKNDNKLGWKGTEQYMVMMF
jgi:hypothetical protein